MLADATAGWTPNCAATQACRHPTAHDHDDTARCFSPSAGSWSVGPWRLGNGPDHLQTPAAPGAVTSSWPKTAGLRWVSIPRLPSGRPRPRSHRCRSVLMKA